MIFTIQKRILLILLRASGVISNLFAAINVFQLFINPWPALSDTICYRDCQCDPRTWMSGMDWKAPKMCAPSYFRADQFYHCFATGIWNFLFFACFTLMGIVMIGLEIVQLIRRRGIFPPSLAEAIFLLWAVFVICLVVVHMTLYVFTFIVRCGLTPSQLWRSYAIVYFQILWIIIAYFPRVESNQMEVPPYEPIRVEEILETIITSRYTFGLFMRLAQIFDTITARHGPLHVQVQVYPEELEGVAQMLSRETQVSTRSIIRSKITGAPIIQMSELAYEFPGSRSMIMETDLDVEEDTQSIETIKELDPGLLVIEQTSLPAAISTNLPEDSETKLPQSEVRSMGPSTSSTGQVMSPPSQQVIERVEFVPQSSVTINMDANLFNHESLSSETLELYALHEEPESLESLIVNVGEDSDENSIPMSNSIV